MLLEEALKCLRNNRETLKQFGLEEIAIFGSTGRNEAAPNSDIDVLVRFLPGKKNYDAYFELHEYLEKLFSKKVDLLTPESLSPYLKPYIEKEAHYERL